jgi:vanillate O-demethylase ferredoxin subunit
MQETIMDWTAARVVQVRDEAIDIKSFELAGADGAPLPPFTPGSHIDVALADGLVRQYSLCGALCAALPGAPSVTYRIAVKREPQSRGGSSAMHQLVQGDQLRIGAPRNHFEMDHSGAPAVLVGGGIGITPLLSMAHAMLADGRPFTLHYFTRSMAHTAFHAELSAPSFAGKVSFHYATEPDQVRAYLRKVLWHHDDDAQLYLCGPRPFMDMVQDTASATWTPEAVHLEYFGANPNALAGAMDSFTVRLARSGGEYRVDAGQSIVEALAAHGIAIETSCEQGVCGTCLTGVLEGLPDHRDVFLTDAEKAGGDKLCACVSRALGASLVLDL